MNNRAKYTEPSDYIPKDIRKKNKLGEFNEDEQKKEKEMNKKLRDYVNGKE